MADPRVFLYTRAMLSFFLFTTLLILLFLLSRLLHKELSRLLYGVTKSKKWTIYTIALLFFPGTLLHELAHFLMARLLFVSTGKMTLLPKSEKDRVALGSVEIVKTDPIRRLLIGAAPFLSGISLLFLTLFYAGEHQLWSNFFYGLLLLFLLFELGNTMFSSRKDMEGALLILSLGLVLGVVLFLLGVPVIETFASFLSRPEVQKMSTIGSWYLLYPLGVNLSLILFFRGLSRLRRQA